MQEFIDWPTEKQEMFFLTLTEQLIVQTGREKAAWPGTWKDEYGRVLWKTGDSQVEAWNRAKTYGEREDEGRKEGQRGKEKWW